MQDHPFARNSPFATVSRTVNCAICQLPVDLLERSVASLAGAVFAHEACALQFRGASRKATASRRPMARV